MVKRGIEMSEKIPTLYVKVMKGKRTTYQEYNPYVPCPELENKVVLTLMSTLVIALMMNYEKNYPEHSRLKRQLDKVKEAVIDLAALNNEPLEEAYIQAGARAWEGAIERIQEFLSGGLTDEQIQAKTGTTEGAETADTKSSKNERGTNLH